jgi:hypothetical protein
MNFWSVQSGEQFYPTDTGACRLANLANVLDDVIEHYLPTAVGGEAAPRETVRARANFAATLLAPEEWRSESLRGTSFTPSAEMSAPARVLIPRILTWSGVISLFRAWVGNKSASPVLIKKCDNCKKEIKGRDEAVVVGLARVLILRTLRKADHRVLEETQVCSTQDDGMVAHRIPRATMDRNWRGLFFTPFSNQAELQDGCVASLAQAGLVPKSF